ncbi:MAG: hypothetical protein J1E06_05815 [Acutalibacter sp.]|nr:hypothetical protein [Acutalibacter sp.]
MKGAINYFKAAEHLLANRVALEQALANLEHRRDRVIQKAAPKGISVIDYSRPYVSGGGANDAMLDCLKLEELNWEIQETREMVEEIDRVISQLEKVEADLLRAWYIEKKSKEEIAELLSYSSKKTIYDMRNKAVAAFAILYFGAGAIVST